MQGDQAATNKKFGELSEYEVKGEVTVLFRCRQHGGIKRSNEQELKELADKALKAPGLHDPGCRATPFYRATLPTIKN